MGLTDLNRVLAYYVAGLKCLSLGRTFMKVIAAGARLLGDS